MGPLCEFKQPFERAPWLDQNLSIQFGMPRRSQGIGGTGPKQHPELELLLAGLGENGERVSTILDFCNPQTLVIMLIPNLEVSSRNMPAPWPRRPVPGAVGDQRKQNSNGLSTPA